MDGTEVGLLGAAGVLLVRVIGPDILGFVRRMSNGGQPTRNGSDRRVDRIVLGLQGIQESLDRHNEDAVSRNEKSTEILNGIRADLQRMLGRGDSR